MSIEKPEVKVMNKPSHATTESTIYHNDDMTLVGICTFGWKSTKGSFPMALVTFIDSRGGEYKNHPIRPFMHQTLGMKAAEQFAMTGEMKDDFGEAFDRPDIRKAAEYVLDPPVVPCVPLHPGFDVQFESQTTLIQNAQIVAKEWLAEHPK